MRIENTNTTSEPIELAASTETGPALSSTAAGLRQMPEDRATLSGAEESIESLTADIMAGASARSARVDALRQSVAAGEYQVSAESVAQAMIEESF